MSDRTSGRTRTSTEQHARQAGRKAAVKADSPWVKTLGQVGVAAIGIVYLLLAWIAVQVAFGGSSKSADNSGALKELAGRPFGRWLLAAMAAGLFAFAVWQVVLAIVGYDTEQGGKLIFKRAGAGAKAVFGTLLGVQALKLVIGSGSSKSSSQQQADWTGKLLGAPAGRALVVLVGLAVLGFAGYLIYEGVEKKFLKKLEGSPGPGITKLGQAGWIARGVAFGVLGVLMVIAGIKHQPEQARGLDQALKTLAGAPYGKWVLTVVALGLASYGVFQVVTARQHKEG